MQIFCGIAQSENETFEKLFSLLQTDTPIIAAVCISGKYHSLSLKLYNDEVENIIYPI